MQRGCGAAIAVALFVGGAVDIAAARPAGGERLTKKQWIRSANRICSNTDDKIDALDQPTGNFDQGLTSAQFEDLAQYSEKAHEYSKDALAALKALKPPKKDSAKVKKIIMALKGAVDAIVDTASAAGDEDGPGAQEALSTVSQYQTDFQAAAQTYGSTCGASNA